MNKLIGSIFILLSGVLLCDFEYQKLKKRIHMLKEIRQMCLLLGNEIRFSRNPLPDAMNHIANRCAPVLERFLRNTALDMRTCHGQLYEIFSQNLNTVRESLPVTKEDIDRFICLGKYLGFLDYQVQMRYLEEYEKEVEAQITELENTLPIQRRIYTTAGLAGSCTLLVLLL